MDYSVPETMLQASKQASNCSVVSDSLQSHGLQSTRLLCPWDFPGQSTALGSRSLLQGIVQVQGLNPGLLHCRQILYQLSHFHFNICQVFRTVFGTQRGSINVDYQFFLILVYLMLLLCITSFLFNALQSNLCHHSFPGNPGVSDFF